MDREIEIVSDTKSELVKLLEERSQYVRFAFAALGSIPWIGGVFAASAALNAEQHQGKVNGTLFRWMEEHKDKIRELEEALTTMAMRIDGFGDEAIERIQQEDYLTLVRKGFKVWDRSEKKEKRGYVQKLLVNASGTKIAEDDIIRLFLDWIDKYHEAHFSIIRAVYNSRGITRLGIWLKIGGDRILPQENSSQADLFRMLIHDLTTGRVIRQEREVNSSGQFLKKPTGGRRAPASEIMKSSFEDEEAYELSELGQEFVHYVLQDAVSRIEGK